jgi:hypothetical protein
VTNSEFMEADYAMLAAESSPERRRFLLNEIAEAEENIEKLRRKRGWLSQYKQKGTV